VCIFQIQFGDAYLYAALEFTEFLDPNIMSLTDWAKEFSTAFQADERIKKYLANRPQYLLPL